MSQKQLSELWADIFRNYIPWFAINSDDIKSSTYWPNTITRQLGMTIIDYVRMVEVKIILNY